MPKNNAALDPVKAAREQLLNDKLTPIKALREAQEHIDRDVAKLNKTRRELKAHETQYRAAFADAKKVGWAPKELRSLNFAPSPNSTGPDPEPDSRPEADHLTDARPQLAGLTDHHGSTTQEEQGV